MVHAWSIGRLVAETTGQTDANLFEKTSRDRQLRRAAAPGRRNASTRQEGQALVHRLDRLDRAAHQRVEHGERDTVESDRFHLGHGQHVAQTRRARLERSLQDGARRHGCQAR